MFKSNLKVRITIIEDLEKEVLQEPNRVLRRKKLSELMSARHNLRLQYYNDNIQDASIQNMLSNEATTFIKFQEKLLTQFGSSNAEFGTCLKAIMDTCEQSSTIGNTAPIEESKKSLYRLSESISHSSNIMKNYRLRGIKRCQILLDQYSLENINNVPRSLDCCADLNKEEMGE